MPLPLDYLSTDPLLTSLPVSAKMEVGGDIVDGLLQLVHVVFSQQLIESTHAHHTHNLWQNTKRQNREIQCIIIFCGEDQAYNI